MFGSGLLGPHEDKRRIVVEVFRGTVQFGGDVVIRPLGLENADRLRQQTARHDVVGDRLRSGFVQCRLHMLRYK